MACSTLGSCQSPPEAAPKDLEAQPRRQSPVAIILLDTLVSTPRAVEESGFALLPAASSGFLVKAAVLVEEAAADV